ncbi:MAG: hypothetical protein WCJ24_02495 [Candidatus Saccharibacteria bacterium]
MINNEFFVPRNLLETCQGWQEVVRSVEGIEAQDQAGRQACEGMRENRYFNGASKVIVKTESALMLPDGLSQEEMVWPTLQFGVLRLVGDLARVGYIRVNSEGTIAWMINNARIIDRPQEFEIVDEERPSEFGYYLSIEKPVRRPLYLPVGLIDYALCAN